MEEKGGHVEAKPISVQSVKANIEKAKPVLAFVVKHAVIFTLIFVLALQFMPNEGGKYPWGGMWLRMQTAEFPIADSAAASSVDNFLRQRASEMAVQQYPNLPDANRQKVIDDLVKKIKSEQGDALASEQSRLAQELRDHYSYDANGKKFLYMPDIDPYFYLRYARNVVEKGHWYDTLKDGEPWDNHMVAPNGVAADPNWHPYVLAGLFTIMKTFSKDITLMEAANYYSPIFIFLSLILIYFITRRFAGNLGGFVAVTMLALLPAVMGRTPWGHADTDAYNVFFPLLIVWLLLLGIDAKKYWNYAFIALAGLATGVFACLWSGWWYVFDFVIGAVGIAVLFELVLHRQKLKEGIKVFWAASGAKRFVALGAAFFISSGIFTTLLLSWNVFSFGVFRGAISFTNIKEASLPTLWPNVFTTVAELNPASFDSVIASIGGMLLFSIACLGILLVVLRKDAHGHREILTSSLLVLWFIGTIYASLKGTRFTLLLGPAFAIAFGSGIGLLYQHLSSLGERQFSVNRKVTGALLLAMVWLVLVYPVGAGAGVTQTSWQMVNGDVPLVNDAWWNTLEAIKSDSQPNAIVNSWWDFGHHFKYISDRAVTFDGSSQNGPQAHWIGRVLQTDNETEAVGILRMLDCGSNKAYELAMEKLNDPLKSVQLVKRIIGVDEAKAKALAKEAGVSEEITKFTHCDPPENYFIASADMIGKAGVWSHFGLWNFERAETWLKWKSMPMDEAVPQMVERFSMTEKDAQSLWNSAQSLSSEDAANAWISPWPNYATDANNCGQTGDILRCNNIAINLTSRHGEIMINNGVGLAEKIIIYDRQGNKVIHQVANVSSGIGIVLWPTNDGYKALAAQSPLVDSVFTRMFFMNGLGLKYFDPFTSDRQLIGGAIYVFKVDWAGSSAFIPDSVKPRETAEVGALLAVNYVGWADGAVFDSSIVDWQNLNVSSETTFDGFDTRPIGVKLGEGKLIAGFEKALMGMKKGDMKVITIPPEEAYGTDPTKHALGNKTLNFRIQVVSVQ